MAGLGQEAQVVICSGFTRLSQNHRGDLRGCHRACLLSCWNKSMRHIHPNNGLRDSEER